MLLSALLCSFALGVTPDPAAARDADSLRAYEVAKAGVGRDSQGHVELALWCEAHGLAAERAKHLALAVLIDPKNAAARGLLGLVAHGEKWQTPEKVAESWDADEASAGRRAEYNARRDKLQQKLNDGRRHSRSEAAQAHVALGMWCERNGLDAEALAHFTSAVTLDPQNEVTWKHIGYVKHDGRWMSKAQAAAETREAEAKRKATRDYEPRFRKLKAALAAPDRRDDALAELATIIDPLTVPAIVRAFRTEKEPDQEVAAQLLGQIDQPDSTRELAALAVFSRFASVRRQTTETLRTREPREFAGLLVEQVHAPMTYQVEPVGGPGAPGALLVETPRFKVLRTYDAPPTFTLGPNFFGYIGYDGNGLPVVAKGRELQRMARESPIAQAQDLATIESRTAAMLFEANLKAASSQQRLVADVRDIETSNARSAALNGRVSSILQETVGAPDLKDDEDGWRSWWYDRLGYRYEAPEQVTLAAVAASPQSSSPRVTSCFAAGTPVRTLEGFRPIEALLVGDQVLSQDGKTGALSFQPILVVHHNAPGATLRIELSNGETLVASVYHRFWRAGRGWAQARELRTGDILRTLDGLSQVVAVEAGRVVPLFNLDVAGGRTFFVGHHGALVHDNTLPDPRARPFDAAPVLAEATVRR